METKENVHVVPQYFLQPTNSISVNLIGVGGTGSVLLTALARINHALLQLGHAGLMVKAFDPDNVEEPNLGRQLFAHSEIGMNKAVALINRINRFFGTAWKAFDCAYENGRGLTGTEAIANITLSCVDTISARVGVADVLAGFTLEEHQRDRPIYWMDFGNSRDSGQVLISTLAAVKQPESRKFNTVAELPPIIGEFKGMPDDSGEDNLPSCSLAQALGRQDLFINSSVADLGASLLWTMFSSGMLRYRGFFLNLSEFRATGLKI